MQIKELAKRAFWKLPLSADMKERLRVKRYEYLLKKEAAMDDRDFEVTSDALLLSEYAKAILNSYGSRSESYASYREYDLLRPRTLLVAYYLTQFHPNPENDAWWGRGTTEWNNVDEAVPQFLGHYQPRRPGELGYYDLRLYENMKRQIEIAKNYGIGAFCFYYYWFDGGKRLLQRPLDQFLADSSLDMPFFYCWANENWTKRFSGTNDDVLLGITQSPENYISFMHDVTADFKDSRYLKIEGRPVLSIYRPSLIPDLEAVLLEWRRICTNESGMNPYLIAVQETDTTVNWMSRGFDAETEFQPKQIRHNCKNITKAVKPIRNDFSGDVYDYEDLVCNRRYMGWSRDKKVYPAVMPMWDNTARRNNKGIIFHGSTPDLYSKWLLDAINEVRERHDLDTEMVFINAWNEWGEGAYLEPDAYWGYAYLDATRKILERP